MVLWSRYNGARADDLRCVDQNYQIGIFRALVSYFDVVEMRTEISSSRFNGTEQDHDVITLTDVLIRGWVLVIQHHPLIPC